MSSLMVTLSNGSFAYVDKRFGETPRELVSDKSGWVEAFDAGREANPYLLNLGHVIKVHNT